MNDYYAEVTAFYDALDVIGLPTSAIALWHALAWYAQKWSWDKPISLAASTLSEKTKLSRDTIHQARNALKNAGLIEFINGKRNEAAKYTIHRPTDLYAIFPTQHHTQHPTQPPTQHPTQCHTQPPTIYTTTSTKGSSSLTSEIPTQPPTYQTANLMTDTEMDEAAARYSEDDQRLLAAIEAIGMQPSAYNAETAHALAASYGTDVVVSALAEAAESDKHGGVNWKFVRVILDGKEKAPDQPKTRTVTERCYVNGEVVFSTREVPI